MNLFTEGIAEIVTNSPLGRTYPFFVVYHASNTPKRTFHRKHHSNENNPKQSKENSVVTDIQSSSSGINIPLLNNRVLYSLRIKPLVNEPP
ncbi:hypothetical protein CDAR_580151 [Caerostris darwini]|uniref:Uncharacterized protein n=1 Tax=Caerostris darwini TaxID=1538125 RepID=A0AAV4PPK6_9ARAC|nr:hypothetical protein CDAR_580151 [Caerostris darwini]